MTAPWVHRVVEAWEWARDGHPVETLMPAPTSCALDLVGVLRREVAAAESWCIAAAQRDSEARQRRG